ncbi:hypothetical protein ACHAP8_008311 [Fusarium lateritium]
MSTRSPPSEEHDAITLHNWATQPHVLGHIFVADNSTLVQNDESFQLYDVGEGEQGVVEGIITPSPWLHPSAMEGQWFLGPETWSINYQSTTCPLPPIPSPMLKAWIEEITKWLHQWIREGQNEFIHAQLYLNTGLPRCLQDAWAVLTAYLAKTEQNEAITMGIVQARTEDLLLQESLSTIPVFGTLERLARVQSLLIYQFIRLFDGNIRQRTLAERDIPILQSWCDNLWTTAGVDVGEDNILLPGSSYDETYPVAELWRKWVLCESIRRTWIVARFTQAVYLTIRDGRTDCPGGKNFTARQGLWNTPSSDAWLRQVINYGPLFTQCNQVNQLLTKVKPSEVDKFTVLQLKMICGTEKIENWMKDCQDVASAS